MDLEKFLSERGVKHRFISKLETIHTADASKVTGIPLNKITKNLIAKTSGGEYVLMIIPGDRRVNLKKAAEALGVINVKLVSPREAEEVSGYPPGGTPSIGLKNRVKTIIDSSLMKYETIYCGGGARNKLLELRVKDVVELSKAIIAEISK